MRVTSATRRSLLPAALLGLALLLVGGLGTVGTLWALGEIDLSFFKRPLGPSHEGMVPIPVTARAIPAYTKITRDDLLDLQTATLKVIYLRPEEVRENMVTNVSKILGRVMGHDKPAGYAFKDDEFLPEGTRPGLVGGIPPGKRALNLEAERIKGIQALKGGDHFDLLSSLPLDDKRPSAPAPRPSPGLHPVGEKHAGVRVLVHHGIVVVPVTVRQVPTGTPARGAGPVQTKPVQEVVIAVDPEEIAPLTEALALNLTLTCVARSGRPEDLGASSTTPGLELPKRHVIEIITGNKRQLVEYPAPTQPGPEEKDAPSTPPAAADPNPTGEDPARD